MLKFERPRRRQPNGVVRLSTEFRNAIGVWKPYAGPVGPVDTSGLGAYSSERTDVGGKYPFHGYYLNGSSELTTIATPAGLAWSGDGSTQKGYRNVFPTFASSDFSMLVQFSLRSVTGTQIIFGGFNNGLGTVWQYGWGFIADGTTLRAVGANNNTSHNATFSGLEIGVVYTAVLTKRGTTLTLYCNGSRSTATGSSSPTQYVPGWLSSGHNAISFVAGGDGWVSLSGLWPEAFADGKADLLHREPLRVFAPQSVPIPVSAGGGPPPTFNPAWARNSNTVLVGGRL